MKKITLLVLSSILAAFFALQPFVIYLTAYDPGDCDDKAVHYYSAAYLTADNKSRNFVKGIYQSASEASPGGIYSQRTEFRINSAYYYPIADLSISFFNSKTTIYTDAVKYGLLATTIIALVLVIIISAKTGFGFWQAALVLNLIAFYSVKLHFIVEQMPRNMHPFITFVPRGAAALLIIPAVLSFAAKKPALFLISLGSIFLFHVGSASLMIPLVLLSILLFITIEKLNLLNSKYFYLVFLLAIIGGKNTFIASISIGALIYLVNRFKKYDSSNFYQRAFYFSAITLFTSFVVSAISSLPRISQLLVNSSGLQVLAEIGQRLTGVQYSALVLMAVILTRLAIDYVFKNYFVSKKNLKVSQRMIIIVILFVLTLNHLSEYSWISRRVSGFFLPSCTGTQILSLPNDIGKLRTLDEPSFFVTLGKYLF